MGGKVTMFRCKDMRIGEFPKMSDDDDHVPPSRTGSSVFSNQMIVPYHTKFNTLSDFEQNGRICWSL